MLSKLSIGGWCQSTRYPARLTHDVGLPARWTENLLSRASPPITVPGLSISFWFHVEPMANTEGSGVARHLLA